MNYYTEEVKNIFKNAENMVLDSKSLYLETYHLFLSIIETNQLIKDIFKTYFNKSDFIKNIEKKSLSTIPIILYSIETKQIINNALLVCRENTNKALDTKTLLTEILSTDNSTIKILKTLGCNIEKIILEINNKLKTNSILTISKLGQNLNEIVTKNNIIYNRDNEIKKIMEILVRKNKCNPLLVGEPGTGKTAIVEYLAYLININKVPSILKDKQIISISMGELVAGTKYRGEFEEKLITLLKEIKNNKNIILFIDEIHTMINAGGAEGAIDAANIMKPILARGNIKCIGATTIEEYHKHIESDKALERRFQKLLINEPNEQETIKILKNIKTEYEDFHNVLIDDKLIRTIVKLTNKYMPYRRQPDKSIDILDQVCAKNNIINNNKYTKLIETFNKNKSIAIKENNYQEVIKITKQLDNYKKTKSKNITIDTIKEVLESNCCATILELENQVVYKSKLVNKIKKKYPFKTKDINNIVNNILVNNKIHLKVKDSDIINYFCKIVDVKIITISGKEYNSDISILKILGSSGENYKSILDVIKDYPQYFICIEDIDKISINILDLLKKMEDEKKLIKNNNDTIYLNLCKFIYIDNNTNKSLGFLTKNTCNNELNCNTV